MERGSRPHRHRSYYSTFAPFPDTRPRNQPALGQTYATVVYGEGRVSGVQMLTVGRGLRTGVSAAVLDSSSEQRRLGTQHPALWPHRQVHNAAGAIPANSLPRLRRPAGSRCSKQHERCVNIAHVNMVTLRYTNPGTSAKREIQGRVSSGGAASTFRSTRLRPQCSATVKLCCSALC